MPNSIKLFYCRKGSSKIVEVIDLLDNLQKRKGFSFYYFPFYIKIILLLDIVTS